MSEQWPAPSPEVAELVRSAAQLFLDAPVELMDAMDQMVLDASPDVLGSDPALAAEGAASNRSNTLHWAKHTAENPGARVPVNLSPEVLAVARDAVRRGSERAVLAGYHAGQNVAWRYCMEVVFSMSSDPVVLREALDVAARSIFTFVDDTVQAIEEQIEGERRQLTRGTHAERFEVATLILEGGIGSDRASERLGYDLRQRHTAAIVWGDPASADNAELTRAAEALARAAGAQRPLTVVASASSLWVWCVPTDDIQPDVVRDALAKIPEARVALGPSASGIDGFRRSHLDAVTTQRLMSRAVEDLRVASFADVQAVALATTDTERAAEFVARTLGDLATADPQLRHTLRIYIHEQFSASRAARALYAHRNTVLNRLQRAQELLPAPLEGRGLEVGLALEMAHWLGAPTSSPAPTRRPTSTATAGTSSATRI